MADTRAARKAAERAARDRLGSSLIGAVGELGAATAEQHAAGAGVTETEERAHEHVRQAQLEAERMVADARDKVAAADERYREAHQAALAAGWSAAALDDMGYSPPATPRKRARQSTARAERDEQDATGDARPQPSAA